MNKRHWLLDERPLWRWWVCNLSLLAIRRTRLDSRLNRLAYRVFGWSVLPAWMGVEE